MSWFDEICSKLLDQRKQAELQQLQNSRQINGDNRAGISATMAYRTAAVKVTTELKIIFLRHLSSYTIYENLQITTQK
jgi:hypothetical protein